MRGEQRWTEVVARRCHGWTRRYCAVLVAMTVVDAARQCAVNKCGCNGERPVCLLAVGEAYWVQDVYGCIAALPELPEGIDVIGYIEQLGACFSENDDERKERRGQMYRQRQREHL